LSEVLSRTVTFVVRSERIGTTGFLEDLQRAVWSVNSSLPLGSVQTLGDLYDRSMARTALTLVLLAIAGAMALGLGLVGIYGVISYMLSLRTREIGIRMALGAHSANLQRLLLRQVLALVLIGTALGLGGAVALAQAMESLLFGVTALDPATYAIVAALLVATAAVAGYLPARHVTRVEPMQALRAE
jgi:ABC-type antimicrobial peptide transport system permease subunit